jgi:hypothetical protein
MFNFSANHLLLLSRMEYRSCVVFLMKDDSTRRVYRLYDFTKSQIITSDHYYCVSGKVNSADKLYLVIESVRRDANRSSSGENGISQNLQVIGEGSVVFAISAVEKRDVV